MNKLTRKFAVAAAVATFSTAGFGAGAAIAQEHQIKLCPDGQTYTFIYECSPITRQCILVWEGCA